LLDQARNTKLAAGTPGHVAGAQGVHLLEIPTTLDRSRGDIHIGGVLLVFSYLVVPTVCANYLVRRIGARFVVGWAIATVASVVSLFVTAKVDLPIGAAIVCVLAVALVLVAVAARFLRRSPVEVTGRSPEGAVKV